MGNKSKGAGGRPSKLTPELTKIASDLASRGKTDAQIADVIGICPKTLDNWKGKYPEFLRSLKEAKQNADELVEASLYRRAIGYTHEEEKIFYDPRSGRVDRVSYTKYYPPDTTACIFWLKNRQPQRWLEKSVIENVTPTEPSNKVGFAEFCQKAGYPRPYPKQEEMRVFGIDTQGAHLLLGARGYGKTDYVTILGVAYDIYLNPEVSTNLIVTKSDSRNAAILSEIANACKANGMRFEKENSETLRVFGLKGKDPSVAALTVRSTGFRGRHPMRIIMDDPVTPEDTSEATRRQVERIYDELLKLTDNILIIGQPVHKYDLFEKVRPLISKMELPYGTIPELDADLEAQRLAGVTEESIQGSYYLNVVSDLVTPFDGVKYIDDFPEGESVAFIDPSFKGGDYTALSIFRGYFDGVAVKGHVHKRAWNHCIEDLVSQMQACNVKKICIETNSLGDEPVIALRRALQGSGIGVIGRDSTNNKHSRILAAGVYASSIHLAKTSDRLYLDHVVKYEYGAKYDDAPDSLATGLCWIGLIRGKE